MCILTSPPLLVLCQHAPVDHLGSGSRAGHDPRRLCATTAFLWVISVDYLTVIALFIDFFGFYDMRMSNEATIDWVKAMNWTRYNGKKSGFGARPRSALHILQNWTHTGTAWRQLYCSLYCSYNVKMPLFAINTRSYVYGRTLVMFTVLVNVGRNRSRSIKMQRLGLWDLWEHIL